MYSNYTSKARRKIDILLLERSCGRLLSVGRKGSRVEVDKWRKCEMSRCEDMSKGANAREWNIGLESLIQNIFLRQRECGLRERVTLIRQGIAE